MIDQETTVRAKTVQETIALETTVMTGMDNMHNKDSNPLSKGNRDRNKVVGDHRKEIIIVDLGLTSVVGVRMGVDGKIFLHRRQVFLPPLITGT